VGRRVRRKVNALPQGPSRRDHRAAKVWKEHIWLETFKHSMRPLHEIVGVDASHVAITDSGA
jgi:hypothetical protein